MTRDDIDIMWNKALGQAIKDGEQFTRYHFAALVAAKASAASASVEQKKWQDQTMVDIHEAVLEEREACAKLVEESSLPDAYSEPVLLEIANDIRARGNNDY